MQPADHVEFGGALAHALFGALVDFFQREIVCAGSVRIAAKGAQLAMRDANIGGIDVAIHVKKAGVAVPLFAHGIREPTEREQVRRAVKRDTVVHAQALAREDFFSDGF